MNHQQILRYLLLLVVAVTSILAVEGKHSFRGGKMPSIKVVGKEQIAHESAAEPATKLEKKNLSHFKSVDVGKDMVSVLARLGYPCEEHYVTTKDGYVLGLFRIPFGKNAATKGNKKRLPVLLQHGLLDSSRAWINDGEQHSLGLVLADAGYDVWMANSRGNTHSKHHVKHDIASAEFWSFTFDDMVYDLEANIDFILAKTGFQSLSYVGHSQGTLVSYAALTSPDFQHLADKININIGLAPIAYMGNQKSTFLRFVVDSKLAEVTNALGVKEFLPTAESIHLLLPGICDIIPTGCNDVISLIYGPSTHLNTSMVEEFVSFYPAGTSVKNMLHWAQALASGKFNHFNYNKKQNIAKYGSDPSPDYHLSSYAKQVPTALFYGGKDDLANTKDVQHLIADLPDESIVFTKLIETFAHVDFVWAMDANELVFKDVLELITKYSSSSH